jgi:hypothetical protein
MTVKLAVFKNGDNIISDISEMIVGDEGDENQRVIGYFLKKPCVVRYRPSESETKSLEISLAPWIILTKDVQIPVSTDWIVTLVEPIDKLKEMYQEDVLNYGQTNSSISLDGSSDSDNTD